jgi:hypothetical protein
MGNNSTDRYLAALRWAATRSSSYPHIVLRTDTISFSPDAGVIIAAEYLVDLLRPPEPAFWRQYRLVHLPQWRGHLTGQTQDTQPVPPSVMRTLTDDARAALLAGLQTDASREEIEASIDEIRDVEAFLVTKPQREEALLRFQSGPNEGLWWDVWNIVGRGYPHAAMVQRIRMTTRADNGMG